MKLAAAFFGPTYDAILANIRMKLQPAVQPRDDDTGRFISLRDVRHQELRQRFGSLPADRKAKAIYRAATVPLTDRQRGIGA